MSAPQTPSQTLGPYFSMVLAHDDADAVMAGPATRGERITVCGRLLDGAGDPVEDGLVEVWQADADGRYHHPLDLDDTAGFIGVGRCRTGVADGRWSFATIRPGRVPAPGGGRQAPHLNIIVQARGMLNPVWTRIYLDDEVDANAADPVLRAVPAERRTTMIACRAVDDPSSFTLDLRLQGEAETVFLDW